MQLYSNQSLTSINKTYRTMKHLIVFIFLASCTSTYSQQFSLEVEYSSGIKDSILFGFDEAATADIDVDFNEVNIYGTALQPTDLRCIQRISDYNRECQYQWPYNENIDTKINVRQYDQDNLSNRTFEFILTSPDTNFNISLKGSNLFVDGFLRFEPDTCRIPDTPPSVRIQRNLGSYDLKPIMRFYGLSTVNYIVFIIEEIGITSTDEQNSANLSILPNPTSHFVNIANDKNSIQEISILDFNGRRVQYEKGINKKEISLNLNPDLHGLYLIRVSLDNKIVTQKLYIE